MMFIESQSLNEKIKRLLARKWILITYDLLLRALIIKDGTVNNGIVSYLRRDYPKSTFGFDIKERNLGAICEEL